MGSASCPDKLLRICGANRLKRAHPDRSRQDIHHDHRQFHHARHQVLPPTSAPPKFEWFGPNPMSSPTIPPGGNQNRGEWRQQRNLQSPAPIMAHGVGAKPISCIPPKNSPQKGAGGERSIKEEQLSCLSPLRISETPAWSPEPLHAKLPQSGGFFLQIRSPFALSFGMKTPSHSNVTEILEA